MDFGHLLRELHGQDGVEATVEMIAELARRELEADYAGVMLLHRGGTVETAAATDPVVERADTEQIAVGEGPCLEAIAKEAVFVIGDTVTEPRWSPWCERVAALGIRSVLSVRLFTARGPLGCLNLYSRRPHRFSHDGDATYGTLFAGHASVALATEKTKSELRDAMDGRHVIGIAQGILMERFTIDKDQAFSVLRRYSQDHNMKLRAVATTVATTGRLPD